MDNNYNCSSRLKSAKDEIYIAEDIDKSKVFFSDTFKRKMNRVFREQAGIKKIPHPEVDTPYERVRSKIVRILLVILDRLKKFFKFFYFIIKKLF